MSQSVSQSVSQSLSQSVSQSVRSVHHLGNYSVNTVGNIKGRRGLCLRYPLIHQRVLNPRTLNQVPKYPVPNTWSSEAQPFCNDGRVTSVASTRQPLLPCQRLEPKVWPKSSCETETTDAFSYYTTKGPKLTKHLLT